MSDFKAKILHQIVCRLGRPRPRWGSLQRSPRSPRWILGAHFEGEGRDERGRERRPEKGRKGKGEGKDRVGGRGGEGAGSTPKLKLGPQNYFPGAPGLCKAHIGLPISVN